MKAASEPSQFANHSVADSTRKSSPVFYGNPDETPSVWRSKNSFNGNHLLDAMVRSNLSLVIYQLSFIIEKAANEPPQFANNRVADSTHKTSPARHGHPDKTRSF